MIVVVVNFCLFLSECSLQRIQFWGLRSVWGVMMGGVPIAVALGLFVGDGEPVRFWGLSMLSMLAHLWRVAFLGVVVGAFACWGTSR